MKNVKTIITLLVLTVTMFSCQTNDDELIEINETVTSKTGQSISTNKFIFIEYDPGVSALQKQQIRDEFEQAGLVFVSVTSCGKNSEVWEVEDLSFGDFLDIMIYLEYVLPDPTDLDAGSGDAYPIDTQYFEIFFSANCNGTIK